MIDVALAGLKFLAILMAGIFGAIGLMVDYKKDGKITLWGKRALVGSIISTLVAVSIESAETYKKVREDERKHEETAAQEKKNAEVLQEIRRGLYPVQNAEFGVHVKMSTPPSEMAAYLNRIRPYIKANAPNAEKEADDDYLLIEDQKALPRPKKEQVADEILHPQFVVRIFKDDNRAKCFWESYPLIKQGCYSDIVMRSDSGADRSLAIGLRTGKVALHIRGIRASVSSAVGGEVASLLDLKGAILSIELRYGDNDDQWIQDLLANAELDLSYGFKAGAYSLPLIRIDQGRRKHIFQARFPDSETQLLK
ncbi:MAG: hypothetical protein A2075_15185 [Geobacteraceae bacterium GWC2_58_44]|nr:MAG: hypothetical protein A2075_15185 [Geobacteraceae bacterium GWC2_58_44]HBG07296.1 hypothetical protein [Geobacter sp.]